jgi:2-polyprenyl-6-methoxyphenol hydroxylase-like FAD-dependent oxidoreductase
MARQAASYRNGRVRLAGDAAHVHYPTGGQGLNLGVQDAVNLGWKLAHVVPMTSPESLLETYQADRHPVAASMLHTTLAQVALLRTADRTNALREIMAELLRLDEPRKERWRNNPEVVQPAGSGAVGEPLSGDVWSRPARALPRRASS